MYSKNSHKPKNVLVGLLRPETCGHTEPISVSPGAVVGESHGASASSATGEGEAAVLTAGVVVVELVGVSNALLMGFGEYRKWPPFFMEQVLYGSLTNQ